MAVQGREFDLADITSWWQISWWWHWSLLPSLLVSISNSTVQFRFELKITKEDNQRSLATNWKMISLSGVRSTLCKKEASERKARTKDCFSPDPPGHSLRMLQRGLSIVLHLNILLLLQLLPHLINIHIPFCSDFSMIYPLKRNAISILFFLGSFLSGKR